MVMVSTENVDIVVNAPNNPTPSSKGLRLGERTGEGGGGDQAQKQGTDQIHAEGGPRKTGIGRGFTDGEPQHGANGAADSDEHPI